MVFSSPWQYLDTYKDLKDGYYEYYIAGDYYSFITHWCKKTGPWVRIVEVDWNNNQHCDTDAVDDVKPHDDVIQQLLTKQRYNCKAVVDKFKQPTNTWLTYPHIQYMYIEKWSSDQPVNNNIVSFDFNSDPKQVNTEWDLGVFNFGTAQGDQYFAYGHSNRNGFVQDFSGAGKGVVYVR